MTDHESVFHTALDQIATRLCRDSLWHRDQCTWFGPSMDMVNGQWQVVHKTYGPDLYAGTCGIALFLGEVNAHTCDDEFARTAHAAMTHALAQRHTLKGDSYAGFYSGLLGLAYACHRLFELTGDFRWDAQVQTLRNELLDNGPETAGLDVVMGSAGAIAPLIELADKRRDDAFMELAIAHGDLLLRSVSQADRGNNWVMLPGMPALTGLAHGAAGGAWALLELADATQEHRYLNVALEAIRWEQSQFNATQQNWPDLRESHSNAHDHQCGFAWCHGAPGIGLSRLRAWKLTQQPEFREQALIAAATTGRVLTGLRELRELDFSYCHGLAGLTELLLDAGRLLEQPQLTQLAQQFVSRACHENGQSIADWTCGVPDAAGEAPGLMLGIAGIGYAILRLLYGDQTPSVLLPGQRNVTRTVTQQEHTQRGEDHALRAG